MGLFAIGLGGLIWWIRPGVGVFRIVFYFWFWIFGFSNIKDPFGVYCKNHKDQKL